MPAWLRATLDYGLILLVLLVILWVIVFVPRKDVSGDEKTTMVDSVWCAPDYYGVLPDDRRYGQRA